MSRNIRGFLYASDGSESGSHIPNLPCTPSRGYLGSRRSRGRNYYHTLAIAAPAISFKLTIMLTMGMSPF